MRDKIREFQGDHRFLSNFWPATVKFEGRTYTSVEQAYVAAKTNDEDVRTKIAAMTPGQAKRFGRRLPLRHDWDSFRVDAMLQLVRSKFLDSEDLGEKLLATGDAELEEGNSWGDRFWGVSPAGSGIGDNNLGTILMIVRSELELRNAMGLE